MAFAAWTDCQTPPASASGNILLNLRGGDFHRDISRFPPAKIAGPIGRPKAYRERAEAAANGRPSPLGFAPFAVRLLISLGFFGVRTANRPSANASHSRANLCPINSMRWVENRSPSVRPGSPSLSRLRFRHSRRSDSVRFDRMSNPPRPARAFLNQRYAGRPAVPDIEIDTDRADRFDRRGTHFGLRRSFYKSLSPGCLGHRAPDRRPGDIRAVAHRCADEARPATEPPD